MSLTYLAVITEGTNGFTVAALSSVSEAVRLSSGKPCRISPIFPVVPDCVSTPLTLGAGAQFIGFFFPLRAYEFIGKQPTKVKKALWFSHGLASTISFATSGEELLKLVAGQEAELSAYEIWQIREGRITPWQAWVRAAQPPPCNLENYLSLSKDARRLLEEIDLNLNHAANTAAIYIPEQSAKLALITEAVNQIIAELKYFSDPQNETVPPHLSKKSDLLTNGNPSFHQRINQGLSHLIQLNSALAYAITQTSHGTVPILECPAVISPNSLLGVGTAYRAVAAVAWYVEGVFEQHPILWVLDTPYRTNPGTEVFRSTAQYDVSVWRNSGLRIDNFLPKQVEPGRPKIAYFSSRLGFGEAHFSITAASQALHASDSVRWSLMTLTHELLHSHVTGILATVFAESVAEGMTRENFETYHKKFKEFMNSPKGSASPPLLDCIRYMIFLFSVDRQDALEKVQNLATGSNNRLTLGGKVPENAELFRSFFNHALRILEELIVHALDLRYFYRGDRDLFLQLLWESWTTVPAVVGDLETYLLRSLVAIGTLETGSVARRFEKGKERLQAKLRDLTTARPENIFLKTALAHVEDSEKSKRLLILSYSGMYVADMAATFLFSNQIEAKFWSDDPNIEPGEDGTMPDYVLETGAFDGGRVINPIPLLANRLKEEFVAGSSLNEDHRSAWLLIAVASATR